MADSVHRKGRKGGGVRCESSLGIAPREVDFGHLSRDTGATCSANISMQCIRCPS